MCRIIVSAIIVLLIARTASAALVTPPNETHTSSIAANVSEQANITIPGSITFNVTNVSADTASVAQTISATNIVMANMDMLFISLKADAANFTPPAGGGVTWAASDISWNAALWTNTGGEGGNSGTLSSVGYNNVLGWTTQNTTSTSTNNLVFTLKNKPTVDRSGNHTLVCTWKIEADT